LLAKRLDGEQVFGVAGMSGGEVASAGVKRIVAA
jgi:hypothetical protein